MAAEKDFLELYGFLEKLDNEVKKCIKNLNALTSKGLKIVAKAEGILTPNIKQEVISQAKDAVFKLIERVLEINCDLELADDEALEFKVQYIPVGNNVELKFLIGDNPWNFWLSDPNVDTRSLHKNLLKKYQNDLLDPLLHPKPLDSVCFVDRNKVFRGFVLQILNENRVKLLDYDSNISKVLTTDKIFKADPDACQVHASTLRCTIMKDSQDKNMWTSDLRDIFCNALKEAVLNVKIIERLPGNFPAFLVDVEMRSEEEGCSTNLKEWIVERLLPEIHKLSPDQSDSVCDFISSEALNPYYCFKEADTDNAINKESTFMVKPEIPCCEKNNLNSSDDKVSCNKVVSSNDNGINCEIPKNKPNIVEVAVSSSEETEVTSSSTEGCAVMSNSKKMVNEASNVKGEIVVDSRLKYASGEFRPRKPSTQHKHSNPHYQNVVIGPYYQQPYPQPPNYANCMPYPNQFYRHNCPPAQPWSFVGPPLQQWNPARNEYPPPLPVTEAKHKPWSSGSEPKLENPNTDESTKICNINNINVNVSVMADEFVPKKAESCHNQQTSSNVGKMTIYNNALPVLDQTVPEQFELRKPRSLLKPGDNLLVFIAHVESPAKFYVHFVSENNKFMDKLNEDMLSYYNSKDGIVFKNWREAKTILGKFCACKWWEDNHWYRVEVLDWSLGDNKVKVFFVDHGNTDVVPLTCLQPLVSKFTKLAMCAQPCHLAQVHPVVKGEPWSEEAIHFFKSKVEVSNQRVYSVTVVPTKEKKDKVNTLSVLLYEGKASEETQSINDLMVDSGMAWSIKHLLSKQLTSSESDVYLSVDERSEVSSNHTNNSVSSKHVTDTVTFEETVEVSSETEDDWKGWDPRVEDYLSSRNNPAIDPDDACVAVSGYSARDEARVCKFFAREGFCWKKHCTKEHVELSRDGVTTDKDEVYLRAFNEIDLPNVGEVIKVKVTAVSSINLFYVQLEQDKGIGFQTEEDEKETLTSLLEFMNRSENILKMKFLKTPPALGQLVLAQYEKQWYRARVISADIEPEVMFVDFGSVCTVNERDLREMEPRYLHLPFQAIECSLANIIPPALNTEEYKVGSDILRETIETLVLIGKVYDSGDVTDEVRRLQVLLQLDNGIDVGEWLVGNNVCTHQPCMSWEF